MLNEIHECMERQTECPVCGSPDIDVVNEGGERVTVYCRECSKVVATPYPKQDAEE